MGGNKKVIGGELKGQEGELEIFNEDTEEWEDAQKTYGGLKNDLERKISLTAGCERLRDRLIERDGYRQIMQKPQGRKKENIDGNSPTILEEDAEKESAISKRRSEFR